MKNMNLINWRNFNDKFSFNIFKRRVKTSFILAIILSFIAISFFTTYKYYLIQKLTNLELNQASQLATQNALIEFSNANRDSLQKITFIANNLNVNNYLFRNIEFLSQPMENINLTQIVCSDKICNLQGEALSEQALKHFIELLKKQNLSDARIVDFIGASASTNSMNFAIEFAYATTEQVNYEE